MTVRPRALGNGALFWAVNLLSLLGLIILAPAPVFFLAVLQSGWSGMGTALLSAYALVGGLTVGLPVGIAGLLHLHVKRLNALPGRIALVLLAGFLSAVIAYTGSVAPNESSIKVLPFLCTAVIAITAWIAITMHTNIRPD